MKDPSDADNCICKPYHMLNDAEDGCIMCAGPGAFIQNDECSCHTSQNAVSVRSVFKLASDWSNRIYLLFNQKSWKRISDGDDIEFPQQTCVCNDKSLYYSDWTRALGFHNFECIECSGPGAILDEKECVCTGYGEEYSEINADGTACGCMTGHSLIWNISYDAYNIWSDSLLVTHKVVEVVWAPNSGQMGAI